MLATASLRRRPTVLSLLIATLRLSTRTSAIAAAISPTIAAAITAPISAAIAAVIPVRAALIIPSVVVITRARATVVAATAADDHARLHDRAAVVAISRVVALRGISGVTACCIGGRAIGVHSAPSDQGG